MASAALRGCPACLSLVRFQGLAASSAASHARTFTVSSRMMKTRNRYAYPPPHMITQADMPDRGGDTFVVERLWMLPEGPKGGRSRPEWEQMNELYKILQVKEVITYPEDMDCLLTDFVDGLGIRGDKVSVKREIFHDELYPEGLAVYASPDNIAEFEEERQIQGIEGEATRLGVNARMTMKELNNMSLNIPLKEGGDWTSLSKKHVQVAFRLKGIELEEECITLPEDEVTDFGELEINVMVNNLESITVPANLVPMGDMFESKKK